MRCAGVGGARKWEAKRNLLFAIRGEVPQRDPKISNEARIYFLRLMQLGGRHAR